MIRTLRSMVPFLLVMLFAVSCDKPDVPDPGAETADNTVDGHEFVDLGLPSGTLWATCNVGADAPEGFGDYFAWGETRIKDIYDWKSYRYGNYDFEQDRVELTKYCTDSLYGVGGFVDNLTVLELVDDAATASWGNGWRTPTRDEWVELFENTSWVWEDRDGVKGRLMTGGNGNSIFLPAAGFREDADSVCTEVGIYWSSTLQTTLQIVAWSYHFTFENCHVCGTYERKRGQVVRAVRSVE